jgi:hypothetical protein
VSAVTCGAAGDRRQGFRGAAKCGSDRAAGDVQALRHAERGVRELYVVIARLEEHHVSWIPQNEERSFARQLATAR